MTIEDFLEILEQRDLVPQAIVQQVRTKVEKGDRRITPQSLLKYLVIREIVSRPQAKELLQTTLTVTPNAESSILGMAVMPNVAEKDKQPAAKPPAEEDIPTIAPLDDGPPKRDSGEGSGVLVTDEGSFVGADLFGEKPASLLADSLSKIGGGEDTTLDKALQESKVGENDPDDPRNKKTRSKKARNKNKNEWDSSLLLLGGGGLILLIIAGVIISYLLNREDADAILAEASEYFEGGSYTQAIKQYDRFVKNHPQHPEYSAGKVKLGLARLWKASSGTSNFSEALKTAEQVLTNIEDESEFSSAQRDLASLLPKIAQGLANQAEKASQLDQVQELVKQTNTALSLCTNTKYIPKTFRDEVLLDEISQTLQRVERERAQNVALAQALTDMQAAVDNRDTALAYQIHDKLLDDHPGLIRNEQLAAKVLEISSAESGVVKFVAETQPATTEPRPSQVVAELALANRSGESVSVEEGVVAVRVSGAVYGLNLADGALRWRRFVGMAPQRTPVQLSTGDLLVVDSRYNELLKLTGSTGKLQWRHTFETPVLRPVLFGDQILLAESSGKLHVLNAASGERQGYVQFAQALSTPPVVGAKGKRVYLVGEHSSLYTLSTNDFSCLGVFFLSHAKGSVTTPPVCVLNKVIVAVAKGLSTSQLEVLGTTADGIVNQRATSRRLSGLVNTRLLSQGRRLVAMTSRGQVAVYEVGSGTGEEALTPIATREAESGPLLARFGFLNKGHVWVAGPNLNKLTILPTSDRLPVSNIDRDYQGDTFDHPLQTFALQEGGDLLVHVRRLAEQAGAIVAAMQMKTGRPQWETELAASPAGPPAVDSAGRQIGAITASGAAFLVDRKAMQSRVTNRAVRLSNRASSRQKLPPLDHCLDLGQGRLVASAEKGERLLHFRPGLPRGALQTINLVGPVSCAPVVWQEGFVVPTQTGQVFLYTSDEGEQWGSPFQPPLAPGVTYHWQSPAVYGSGENSQLVLSDGTKKVYLLSQADSPQPHLTATANADISTAPLNTRFAVVGDLAVAGAEDGSLAVIELPTLASKPSVKLQAAVTWGPFTVGQNVVLATATEELICLDDQANLLWRQPHTHGPPAGQPIAHDGKLVLLWQQGGLSKINLSGGEEVAYVPLPQPVVAGPVPFGKRLVVSAYDGTLLVVDYP
ncbi:MAG: PQQ-binding-like beta-propeller repeat protein [Planctomycetes bacterium]|nr:PQQ-binding-like beta-propeller repeat protein [Planctomycetota bacterium]